MWEITFYFIIAPLLTLIVTLCGSLKFKKYWLGPATTFILLNIPTVIVSIFYRGGWEGVFGWAVFYTTVSGLISLIVWLTRKKLLSKVS